MNDKGFTLLELIVCTAIIAIMLAMGLPDFISWMANQKLMASAENVNAAVLRARTVAIRENAPVVVSFDTANNSFAAFLDNGAGGGTRSNAVQDGTEETIVEGVMESGVNLSQVEFGTAEPPNSYFMFDGQGFLNTAVGSGFLNMTNGKNKQTGVVVNMGGVTNVKPISEVGSSSP